MAPWLKRFGLHLAAAVGATGIFVAAAAVGANQTRQHVASIGPPSVATAGLTPGARGKPSVGVDATDAQPTPRANPPRRTPAASGGEAAAAETVRPERSLAGTIQDVQPDWIEIKGIGGRTWRVAPAPGALIRLNGRGALLDALHVGDAVVILGQAEPRNGFPNNRFLAHAITARRK